ncbi:MAG: hypothetical protein ACKOPE_13700 [Novosphingobium sp.]
MLLGVSVPATAAEVAPKYTAEQDLRCAAVILIFAGDKLKGEQQAGFGIGMGYFIGRWESVTGQRFEDGLTPEYLEDTAANITKYNKECGERLIMFGGRMRDWGKKLQEIGASKK